MRTPPTPFGYTPEQWLQEIATLLDQRLKPLEEALRRRDSEPAAEYLTTKEALAMLRITKPTLNKLRSQNRIQSYACADKRVLYRRAELEAYLHANVGKGGKAVC